MNIGNTPTPRLSGWSNLKVYANTTAQATLSADFAALLSNSSPYSGALLKISGTNYVADVTIAGPAAGGRDQAGAFSASSWLHLYGIYNPTAVTFATIWSTVAPPTGPTLPTNYTQWVYAGAYRFDGSSHLVPTRIMGNNAYYETRSSVLSNGTATTQTSISLSGTVPPNSSTSILQTRYVMGAAGSGTATGTLRHVSGSDYFVFSQQAGAGTPEIHNSAMISIPMTVAQTIYYLVSGTSSSMDIWVLGYSIANGAS